MNRLIWQEGLPDRSADAETKEALPENQEIEKKTREIIDRLQNFNPEDIKALIKKYTLYAKDSRLFVEAYKSEGDKLTDDRKAYKEAIRGDATVTEKVMDEVEKYY